MNMKPTNESAVKMGSSYLLSSSSALNREFFRLLKVGIKSINVSRFIREAVRVEKTDGGRDFLSINSYAYSADSKQPSRAINRFELKRNVYVAAFGKAALNMSTEIERLIGGDHLVKGVAIIPYEEGTKYENTKHGETNEIFPAGEKSRIQYFYGARKNLPDMQSLNATKKVVDMCSRLGEDDVLLTLISGGGSALLSLPIDITTDLHDNLALKLTTIKSLIKSGANINELNTVRSCLSQVKGGNLAVLARRATIISLIISDVIDDPLEIIASGPTCPSFFTTCFKERMSKSLSIIQKYKLEQEIPRPVIEYLVAKGSTGADSSPNIKHPFNYLIFNNKQATDVILTEAGSFEYDYRKVLGNSLSGEARIVGYSFACLTYGLICGKNSGTTGFDIVECVGKSLESLNIMEPNETIQCLNTMRNLLSSVDDLKEKLSPGKKLRACLISGGETTVSLNNIDPLILEHSKGGRNQEMTLAFEILFDELMSLETEKGHVEVLFSSFGSDGIDGPTDAAGAYYEYPANKRLFDSSLTNSFLHKHDSYNYFAPQNRLLITGPTGTNVSDLQILILNF